MNNQWQQFWQQDSGTQSVLTNQEGVTASVITRHWQELAKRCGPINTLLSVACGSGSELVDFFSQRPRSADADCQCIATDISEQALVKVQQRLNHLFPNLSLTLLAEDAGQLEQIQQAPDLIISQFGIEYAGTDAVAACCRLLAADGRLSLVLHYRDGVLDRQTQQQIKGLYLCLEGGFLVAAEGVVRALSTNDHALIQQAIATFQPTEQRLHEFASTYPAAQASKLYADVRQLLSEAPKYGFDDLLSWLEDTKHKAHLHQQLLHQMHEASLNQAGITRLVNVCEEHGIRITTRQAIKTNGQNLPIAWLIEGEKH